MIDFSGQTVLITGAAGGIGRALCQLFMERNAALIALDQSSAVLAFAEELSRSGGRVSGVVADIADRVAVIKALAPLDPIDVLVNNAGFASAGTLASTTPAIWEHEIAVNLNGAYYCTEAVLPAMQQRRRGVIINIGSVNGLTTLGNPAYSAAKAALISYTQALAVEYGRYDIRANIVCPGTVQTPAWRKRVEQEPEVFARLQKWYPLGRIAEPIDIAKAVAFLASDDARVITGAVLTVDAGLMAGNAVMAAELTLEAFS
jgi:NAD(P)-dependent dehydrogenase (short-subunit alcohol dehydrogenase family)